MKYKDIIRKDQILYSSSNFFIVEESFPFSPGHMLILPKSDEKTYFDFDMKEHLELQQLILKCRELIESVYSPDGYNIEIRCTGSAGQTTSGFYCIVVPRYKDI